MSRATGFPEGSTGPGAAESAVRIDRLALRVTGLDEGTARALARLVAEGLDPGQFQAAGNADLGHLRIEVTADAADEGGPDLLARRIADALGRVLAHGQAARGAGGEAVR